MKPTPIGNGLHPVMQDALRGLCPPSLDPEKEPPAPAAASLPKPARKLESGHKAVAVVEALLNANLDPSDTKYGILSEEETDALIHLTGMSKALIEYLEK